MNDSGEIYDQWVAKQEAMGRRVAPHQCDTPATGMPLDEWVCPACGKRWWATLVWPEDQELAWREIAP